MTLHSMTAFATLVGRHGRHEWVVDAKSVNGRGLDLKMRLPSLLDPHEAGLRKRASAILSRGTVSLFLRLDGQRPEAGQRIDHDLLDRLAADAREAARRTGLAAPTMDAMLRLPGIVVDAPAEEAEDGLPEALVESLEAGLRALNGARAEEGARLADILGDQLDALAGLTDQAEAIAAGRPRSRAERLREMVADLDVELDPERLAQEIALLAVRIDTREEVDRLRTHIASARDLLASDGPVGRRLEFLSQELNREANTLCSKSGDAALTGLGVEMKVVIDRFREQVMNVE